MGSACYRKAFTREDRTTSPAQWTTGSRVIKRRVAMQCLAEVRNQRYLDVELVSLPSRRRRPC
jgi:hypothetical protein